MRDQKLQVQLKKHGIQDPLSRMSQQTSTNESVIFKNKMNASVGVNKSVWQGNKNYFEGGVLHSIRNLPIEDKLKMRYINEISEHEKRVPVSPIKSQPPTVNDKPTFNTLSCKSIAISKSKVGSDYYVEVPKHMDEFQKTYLDKMSANTEFNKRVSDKLINFLRVPLYEKFQMKQDEIRKKLIEDFESIKAKTQKVNKNQPLSRFNTVNENMACKRK